MGQIINVTAGEDRLPEALTATVKSGFRTGEYLADRPAIDAVEDDETVQFVVTNRKQGLRIRGGTTRHVLPDRRYETVVVVTDRRVLALVGKVGGDRQFALDISEITDVGTATKGETGLLTIERADGTTWGVHTAASGLSEVAAYLRDASDGCETGGRVRAATESIRGLFEATVGSAKSLERDRIAGMIPTAKGAASGESDEDGTAAASPESRTSATAARPDKPDTETAIDDILQALAKTDWRARGAKPESPFDLLAEREDELVGVVVHCPEDGRIDRSTIERCDAITGAAGTDTVMLATTADIRSADARLAADLGVRLRNVATLSDTVDPPTIEALTEMVHKVLAKAGWSVRPEASGPFDLLADSGDELLGVVVHSPEDGTVGDSIEKCDAVTGAAGTDTVMLATTGTVREADERLADDLGVRLVESESLAQRHVTEIDRD
ncbi:hypothetical protein [Haloarcula onubensis]|uniref:Uncharacterized protein n=1 Tax=Haloarcula onubensis TaxID=2950539 RepID=A0ABU2FQ99_9EURY|nr:hypothetical protein [Halomicroarcula sp. S3CR25-11]MDS0282935.1 hypothetical protein [Halomicroarcula sp. S3CR25-11]